MSIENGIRSYISSELLINKHTEHRHSCCGVSTSFIYSCTRAALFTKYFSGRSFWRLRRGTALKAMLGDNFGVALRIFSIYVHLQEEGRCKNSLYGSKQDQIRLPFGYQAKYGYAVIVFVFGSSCHVLVGWIQASVIWMRGIYSNRWHYWARCLVRWLRVTKACSRCWKSAHWWRSQLLHPCIRVLQPTSGFYSDLGRFLKL